MTEQRLTDHVRLDLSTPASERAAVYELGARGYALLTPEDLDKLGAYLVAGATAETAQVGQVCYARAHGLLQSMIGHRVEGRGAWAEPPERPAPETTG